jgi:prepilin-type processing-associated H-X9-DG protein
MAKKTQYQPRGFTINELVATIAAVGLLAGLLPAALEEARSSARRTQCQDHLKIIGLALHNYHDTYNTFPPGWVQADAHADSPPGYGWQRSILPFTENMPLYNKMMVTEEAANKDVPGKRVRNTDFPPMPSQGTPTLQTVVAVYRCPSDPTEPANSLRSNFGTSNYSGNFGSVAEPRWAPAPLAQFWPGAVESPEQPNGIFWRNSKCRIADIRDGTTNTFAVGERCITSAAGIWPGVTSNQNRTDQATDCVAGNEINSDIAAYSSLHPGGSNFLFCDATVRFLKETIDSGRHSDRTGIYQWLSGRNDGQVIGTND